MSRIYKSDWLDDWYVIQGPWACIEGEASEWRLLLSSLRKKENCYAGRRLALTVYESGRAKLYSPRNCSGPNDCVRLEPHEVDDFAAEVEAVIGEATQSNDLTSPTN